MKRNLVLLALIVVVVAGFAIAYLALTPADQRGSMGMADRPLGGPNLPPVLGYAAGEEIAFVHSETSDPDVAELLTGMMESPVLVVPALAAAPEGMLANVYVFTNGVEGAGPLGFQPDVFDHPAGSDGYSPLRVLHRVTWSDEATGRELRSAAEVQEAEAAGELTIEQTDVIVNMPMLAWPGGER